MHLTHEEVYICYLAHGRAWQHGVWYSLECGWPVNRHVFLVPPTGVAGDDTVDSRGRYLYMADLLTLEESVPSPLLVIPPYLQSVATPLRLQVWRSELSSHPDPEFRRFLLRGIEHGFRIGFDYEGARCRKASRNMPSAAEHPEPIEKYLANELGAGRIIGLLPGDEGGCTLIGLG